MIANILLTDMMKLFNRRKSNGGSKVGKDVPTACHAELILKTRQAVEETKF
jgi:hypothetical protein